MASPHPRGATTRIDRHPVDVAWCRQRASLEPPPPALYVQAMDRDLSHANACRVITEQYAGFLAVAVPESPQICAAIRLGARAMAALFGGAAAEPPRAASDLHHAGNWLGGFFLAAIVRETELLDALCDTPTEVLRASVTRSEEYAHLYVDALRAFWRRQPDAPGLLLQALRATDPEYLDRNGADYALDVVVPQMDVLFRVMDHDQPGFNAALARALERHRGYWARGERQRDPRAYVAFALTALAAFAHDAGLKVVVESDYLPARLVRGDCPR
jgi:hypothetical protein